MYKQELIDLFATTGYDVFNKKVDIKLIDTINKKTDLLVPHRGHAMDHKYYPADKITECKDLSVWWSQELSGWPEVQEITKQLINVIGPMFNDPD